MRSVLHVLYLLFNEGYATSAGTELARTSTVGRGDPARRGWSAPRRPDDAEAEGLLALMLLTDARRPARTGTHGELVPLAEQDRTRWDRTKIREGVALDHRRAATRRELGEYQAQAAIAAVHDQARDYADTELARDPRVVPRARAHDRQPDGHAEPRRRHRDGRRSRRRARRRRRSAEAQLGDHHRVAAVRGHLFELAGRRDEAVAELRHAAARTSSSHERDYLALKAATLARA